MAATFVTKKCSYTIKLYKVINLLQITSTSRNSPIKQVTNLSAWLYCCVLFKYGIKDGYQWANHNILSAFIWNWKNVA